MTEEKIKERVLLQERLNQCERARLVAADSKTLPRRELEQHIAAVKHLHWPVEVMVSVTERIASDYCLQMKMAEDPDAIAQEIARIFKVWDYLNESFEGHSFDGLNPRLGNVAAMISDAVSNAQQEGEDESAAAESMMQAGAWFVRYDGRLLQ